MLQVYNTLSRELENFKPLKENKVKFYACGPTVYNYAHIGNLCCYVFDDIVIRTLRFLGYSVDPLMNLTDIDDKTIRDSQKENMTLSAFTQQYSQLFFTDLQRLNITSFERFKPISELVPEMISITQRLLDTNNAYISDDGSVYFDIKSCKQYGNLAHLDMKGMKAGARVKSDEYEKENISDFALWKGYHADDGDNYWEAQFRVQNSSVILKGRPGWHIECSACNMWGHGEQIDIHMGGCDLIFPHHQNEIAQTEAVTGKTFSTYWMHTGHLLVDGKKMSKSAGNFYRLRDLEEKYPNQKPLLYRAFRMTCLQNRYRENFNFTFERLEGAMATVNNIDNALKRIKNYTPKNTPIRRSFRDLLQESMMTFVDAIEDDIDTVVAITPLFELIDVVNRDIDNETLSEQDKGAVIDIIGSWDMVMGIVDWSVLAHTSVPTEITEKAQARVVAKENRDYALADTLRKEIEAAGFTLIDTKEGFIVEKK